MAIAFMCTWFYSAIVIMFCFIIAIIILQIVTCFFGSVILSIKSIDVNCSHMITCHFQYGLPFTFCRTRMVMFCIFLEANKSKEKTEPTLNQSNYFFCIVFFLHIDNIRKKRHCSFCLFYWICWKQQRYGIPYHGLNSFLV